MPIVKPAWLTLIICYSTLMNTDGGVYIYSEQLKPVSYALHQIIAQVLLEQVQLRRYS